MHIVEDHVVRWRWCHISRRENPNRNWLVQGYRKHEHRYWRRRRRQCDESWRWRRKKDGRRRRRRCEIECRIVKGEHRTVDIEKFVRRRRRYIVVEDAEGWWRFELGC
jgi:hypothetical protein